MAPDPAAMVFRADRLYDIAIKARDLRRAEEKADLHRTALHVALVRGRAAGLSLRRLAEESGYSFQRVAQIVRLADRPSDGPTGTG